MRSAVFEKIYLHCYCGRPMGKSSLFNARSAKKSIIDDEPGITDRIKESVASEQFPRPLVDTGISSRKSTCFREILKALKIYRRGFLVFCRAGQ